MSVRRSQDILREANLQAKLAAEHAAAHTNGPEPLDSDRPKGIEVDLDDTTPPAPKTPAQIFSEVCEEYGAPHFPTKRNPVGSLNEPFWAALYRCEHDILFEPNENTFYEFGGDIYRSLTTHLVLDRLSNRLRKVAIEYDDPFLNQLTGTRHLNGAISHLKGQTEKKEAFNNEQGLIHVANGVLDIRNGGINLLPFSPRLISRNLIPIEYKPKAQCTRFITELLGLLDEDDRDLLRKFMGQYLLGNNITQKILILHGLGETGKSTFSEVARKLIGVTNCAELRTHLLHERFEIGSYIGKNLLIGADVSGTFLNSRGAYRLKAIVGRDLLDAERKGANFRFQIPGTFNVLITSNSRLTARIENDRGPWERRLAIIEYEKPRTAKIIPGFAEMLIRDEGSGILLFATEGLLALHADIKEHGTIALNAKQRKRVESMLNESDGLRLFLTDTVEPASGFSLATSAIVEKYAGYCSEQGWNMTMRKTEEQLPELMMELFQVSRSHNVPHGETKGRGYRGVRFK
jgi:P4 family phage/plasmid primase-like protien